MQPAGYAVPGLVAGNSTALVLVLLSQFERVGQKPPLDFCLFTCKLQSDSPTGAATRHFFHFLSSVLLYSTLH